MSDNNHIQQNQDGAIEIPVIVGGRLLYHYTIDPIDIRRDMRQMWLTQLEAKRWFTPRLKAEFVEIYDKALVDETTPIN